MFQNERIFKQIRQKPGVFFAMQVRFDD